MMYVKKSPDKNATTTKRYVLFAKIYFLGGFQRSLDYHAVLLNRTQITGTDLEIYPIGLGFDSLPRLHTKQYLNDGQSSSILTYPWASLAMSGRRSYRVLLWVCFIKFPGTAPDWDCSAPHRSCIVTNALTTVHSYTRKRQKSVVVQLISRGY